MVFEFIFEISNGLICYVGILAILIFKIENQIVLNVLASFMSVAEFSISNCMALHLVL